MKFKHRLFGVQFVIGFLMLCTQAKASDYYWVGGSGNWSQIAHWSSTSGGAANKAVAPSINDNVIFDDKSGFIAGNNTVTVSGTSVCLNMTWQNSPVPPNLVINNTLQINGSVVLQTGMTINSLTNSTITFAGNTANTITSNGVNVNGILTSVIAFSGGASSSWIFTDNFTSNRPVTLNSGALDFNGKAITLASFKDGTGAHSIKIANAIITVGDWAFTRGSALMAINSAGSVINGSNFTGKSGDVYNDVVLNNLNTPATLASGSFNNVTFLSNGNIAADIITGTLNFTPDKSYTFTSGTTTTITTAFNAAAAACSGSIRLSSSASASAGTIAMAGTATTNVANAAIQDIRITGSGTYTASNSADMGGNSGWTFTNASVNNYWVGGSGDWKDINHWANSSPGTGGTGCVPTATSHVFFDVNSGFTASNNTVTISQGGACNDMTWSGATAAPTLAINSELLIAGSLELQPGMSVTQTLTGNFLFANNALVKTIKTNGVLLNTAGGNSMTFRGTGSTWLLQDMLNMPNDTLVLSSGTLNFNGQNAIINSYRCDGIGLKLLNIAGATIECTVGTWAGRGTNMTPITTAGSLNSKIIMDRGNFNPNLADKLYDVEIRGNGANVVFNGTATSNKLSLLSNVNFGGINYTTNIFEVAAGKSCVIAGGARINTQLIAGGTSCSSGITQLVSGTPGTQVTFTMVGAATTNVTNTAIEDVAITGSGVYPAVNSFDLGNNQGWTFTQGPAENYYWVGGAGNWNDVNHWANTPTGLGGSGCIPSPGANVFFTNTSGFLAGNNTVTIDANAYCKDMTWTNAAASPILQVNNPITMAGSLTFQATLNVNGNDASKSRFQFVGDGTKNITTNGANVSMGLPGTNNGFFFNGAGTWQMQDDFIAPAAPMILLKGNVNFNGKTVSIYSFTGISANSNSLNITGAKISTRSFWNYNSSGATPLDDATTAASAITVNGNFTASPNDLYSAVIVINAASVLTNGKYHSLSFQQNGTISTDITADTLSFAAGKVYIIAAGTTTTVNKKWYASGNPCFVTTVTSSSSQTANISMPASTANFEPDIYGIDFVHLSNMNAVTGAARAKMQLGHYGTDGGNNPNWIILDHLNEFDPLNNITVCEQSLPYTISTVNFFPTPTTTFLWDNSTTASERTVTRPGVYSVRVNYGNCVISDGMTVDVKNNLNTSINILSKTTTTIDVQINATTFIGTPQYTLDSLMPADPSINTPITQASNIFTLPVDGTAYFTIEDLGTLGCATPLIVNLSALPVTLLSFSGKRQGTDNVLRWSTTMELNTKTFDIEYAGSDQQNFAKAGSVDASQNSNTTLNYSFVHHNIFNDAYYRLKSIDIDGSFTYSKVIKVLGKDPQNREFDVIAIMQSPSSNNLAIQYYSKTNTTITARLMDVSGKMLQQKNIAIAGGQGVVALDNIPYLASGVYVLQIQDLHGNVVAKKFIK